VKKKYILQIVLLLVCIIFPKFFELIGSPITRSTLTLIDLAGIYAIVAIGYNILLGFGGQISLGHAAFIGIGAYVTANLAIHYNVPFIVAILASCIVCGIMGLLLGLPALRLEGNYLAIATLGFGVAFEQVFMEFESFTGGFSGIEEIPPASIFGFEFDTRTSMYYFILFFIVLAIIVARNILKTKTGRALKALRDSETAAEAMGVNLAKYKTTAFVVSAMYAGVAGSLYAYLFKQLYPQSFGVSVSLNLLAMIVIGGMASIPGAIIGAGFMTLLPEYIKAIPIKNSSYILTGVLLILTVMYCPNGIMQIYEKIKHKIKTSFGNRNPKPQKKGVE
jgi:branched-chain amino acid transport system permease protein